jgi:hypothetical protein
MYEPGEVRNSTDEHDANAAPETSESDDNFVNGNSENVNERGSSESTTHSKTEAGVEAVFPLEVPFFTKIPDFDIPKDEKFAEESSEKKNNGRRNQSNYNRNNFENKESERKHRHESRRRHFRGW